MAFLDQTGLTYFYNKIKEKFVRSINSITPDSTGNVAITNVPTADNLTSPDEQTSYGTYIYRTSGGDVSLSSGEAQLLYIEGNMEISGRQEEQLNATATNGIIITINKPTWRASAYGSTSGTYNFIYSSNSKSWSPDISNYGLTAQGIVLSNVSASVSGTITSASVTKSTWETQITNSGIYTFIYDGTNWNLNNSIVDLVTYGITISDIPAENDIITVTYTAATPDSTATVEYIKGELGTISIPKPTTFSATGFNQCDSTTMILNNATIANGYITSETGKYICYCKAVGGVTNGYVAYSSGGYITDIGWCETLPQESTTVLTENKEVTSTVASIPFTKDGYVVVVLTNTSDICIHPKWSGVADMEYETYTAPSVITFPTTGTIDSRTVTLPLATYGMPAVGNVADKLDLDGKMYIQRVGRYQYNAENLATVQSMNVPYEYDNNYIYYVLTTPITYMININSTYIVNDWGTEEFIGTTVPVVAQTLYGQNLRDKLRLDVESKKFIFYDVPLGSYTAIATKSSSTITNISINQSIWSSQITNPGTYMFSFDGNNWSLNSEAIYIDDYGISITGFATSGDTINVSYNFNSGFVADTTYEDFGYKKMLTLTGVTSTMVPEIIFNLSEALSGKFAPIIDSYNGGIYIYANEIPTELITIPVIICWRGN